LPRTLEVLFAVSAILTTLTLFLRFAFLAVQVRPPKHVAPPNLERLGAQMADTSSVPALVWRREVLQRLESELSSPTEQPLTPYRST
jgi:hypothetical protein